MNRFVLDCSATVAWLFGESSAPLRALEQLEAGEAVAPPLWRLELANVLLVAERRDRISATDSANFLALLSDLPIAFLDASLSDDMPGLISAARPHQLTAYDAVYLQLARKQQLPLCTLDRGLAQAAQADGIELMIDRT